MDAGRLKGLRVAIYARYSSDNQRQSSIEDQVRRCREHIARVGGTYDVNLVFADHAVSGASLQRRAFEQMMAMAEARPRAIDAIVTEDLSRVSRDFADAAQLFKRLQYLEVPLVGVADGIDTSMRGAKMGFTLKSLISDMYLDDLRDKTHRGLVGRALQGYSTGALPYGYRSRPEVDAHRRVVGHVIEIDEAQATVVRRMYAEYLEGRSLAGIATLLNGESVPPPRAHTLHRRTGWVASTVRAMLHNATYTGRWVFNAREWRKVPGTNRRLPRARGEEERITSDRPHLRIIDEQTWAAVQAKLAAVRAHYGGDAESGRKGRSKSGRATNYLFSSILHCDRCGAPMMIAGGSSAKYYGCADARKRGTCPNRHLVREDVVRETLLAALRKRLMSPAGILHARKLVAEQLGAMERVMGQELREREARLARTEERIKGLIAFIADGDRSDYVVQTLRDLEAQARAEKAAIADLRTQGGKPVRLPSPDEMMQTVFDLEARLAQDPLKGREALRRLFHEGKVRLAPRPDGSYLARGALLPLTLLIPPKKETPAPEDSQGPACSSTHCGGRI